MSQAFLLLLLTLSFFSFSAQSAESKICSGQGSQYEISKVGKYLQLSRDGLTCLLAENTAFRKEKIRTLQVRGFYDHVEQLNGYDFPDLESTEGYKQFKEKIVKGKAATCTEVLGRDEAFLHMYVKEITNTGKIEIKQVINSYRTAKGWPILFLNRCADKPSAL